MLKIAKSTPVANAERGEVALEVRGPNGDVVESYVLVMNTNALARLEEVLGQHIHKLMPRLVNPGMADLRALLCAGLGEHHPAMGLKDCGNLIDKVGFQQVIVAVTTALERGFPDPDAKKAAAAKDEGAQGKEHGRGTGPASSPTRRKRASARASSGA